MKRLFWVGVGAAITVVVIRRSRAFVDAHTPDGVTQAVGVARGLGSAVREARSEFTTGRAEREAELRAGLLGDVDLDAARTRTDAWRAERAEAKSGPSREGRRRASSSGTDRGGRHADPDAEPAPQAQDADDGDLGYSFF